MTTIELDDDLAAALKAKADAQHLKLEAGQNIDGHARQ